MSTTKELDKIKEYEDELNEYLNKKQIHSNDVKGIVAFLITKIIKLENKLDSLLDIKKKI